MIIESEHLMVSPTDDSDPTLRKSHFLKPIISPQSQPPPKPQLHSLTSNTKLKDLTKRVDFKGSRPRPVRDWKGWVYDLEKTHQSLRKKVGIFDAIKASTYEIKRDNELLIALAERWCCETNTFMFPWGEATVTLEDVMILGGFSVLGVSVRETCCKDRNFMEIEAELRDGFRGMNSRSRNKVSHVSFMKYFRGMGGEIEHVAFLVVWLLRHVFSRGYYMSYWSTSDVGPIAVGLARGTKFALAPAVLASIYTNLSILKKMVVTLTSEGKTDDSNLHLWAPFHLVQLWAWERFPTLAPRAITPLCGDPRVAGWTNVWRLSTENHRLEIESSGDTFLWRPYAMCLKNWELPKFYIDKEMWVELNYGIGDELLSFARCLSPCELVGLDCVEQYLPHRVGLQFGLDQDIPELICRTNYGDAQLTWSTYDTLFAGSKLYLSPRLSVGGVTLRYSEWWRGQIAVCDDKCASIKRQGRRASEIRSPREIQNEEEEYDGGKTLSCSPITCDKAMASTASGVATAKMTKGGNTYKSSLFEATGTIPDTAIDLPIVTERRSQCDHVVQEKNKEIDVNDCNAIVDSSSKGSDRSQSVKCYLIVDKQAVTNAEPLTEHLCSLLTEHEQCRAAPDIDIRKGNSFDDPMIIDGNKEEKSKSRSVLGQISELRARTRILQKLVALIDGQTQRPKLGLW